MKRIIVILLAFVLCGCLLGVTASADASPSAAWTGPGEIRAGNTITVTFTVTGENIIAIEAAELYYDENLLTLTSWSQKIGGLWLVEFYDGVPEKDKPLLVSESGITNSTINGETAIFSLTFKVKNNAVTGETLRVSCKDVKLTYKDYSVMPLGEISFEKQISHPLPADNKLKSLTVSNATLNPAFDPNTTFYTAQVPYNVTKLDITAKPNQDGAKVSINNPQLSAGGATNITITVTAENGTTKTYTISVTRGRDPDYVAAGDSTLSNLVVEGFVLSPTFSPDKTDYIVWVPYETEVVNVTGTPNHEKATVAVQGGQVLFPGQDNTVLVTCIAENGNDMVYTIIVKRAAPHDAGTENPDDTPPEPSEPENTEPPTEPPTEPSTEPTEEPTQESTAESTQTSTNSTNEKEPEPARELNLGALIMLSILILLVGIMSGILIGRASQVQ